MSIHTIADRTTFHARIADDPARAASPSGVMRWRWALLCTVAVGSGVVAGGRGDWNRFVLAGRAMLGPDRWSVFVRNHDVQTGPVSLLVSRALAATPRDGFVACVVVCALLGLCTLMRLQSCALPGNSGRDRGAGVVVGGVLLLFTWSKLGGYGHLDDALVLAFAVFAVCVPERQRRNTAALLIGLAIAIKPWAVIFVPITYVPCGSWRKRLAGPALCSAVGAILWAPFVLLQPQTLSSLKPTVNLAPDSVLRLFGISSNDLPAGIRMMQLIAALAVVSLAVKLDRKQGAILVGLAVRLAMDPGTWSYYTAGFVLGAFVWDMCRTDHAMPWFTVLACALLLPPWMLPSVELRTWMRLIACVGAVVVVFADVVRSRAAIRHDRSAHQLDAKATFVPVRIHR